MRLWSHIIYKVSSNHPFRPTSCLFPFLPSFSRVGSGPSMAQFGGHQWRILKGVTECRSTLFKGLYFVRELRPDEHSSSPALRPPECPHSCKIRKVVGSFAGFRILVTGTRPWSFSARTSSAFFRSSAPFHGGSSRFVLAFRFVFRFAHCCTGFFATLYFYRFSGFWFFFCSFGFFLLQP